MDIDSLTETFENAGLSPYQAAVYVALLDLRTVTATQVANESDIPTPRVYDVVDVLTERGYVEKYEQGTIKLRAHSPPRVLKDRKNRIDQLEYATAEVTPPRGNRRGFPRYRTAGLGYLLVDDLSA